MLRNANSLVGYSVFAIDGVTGEVDDFFFDDKTWSLAYLVVKAPDPSGAKRVLLPPTAFGKPDAVRNEFPVAYSREQVKGCPAVAASGSTLDEDDGWQEHLMFNTAQALGAVPLEYSLDEPSPQEFFSPEEEETHLHRTTEIVRQQIHSFDGRIGRIEEIIVDDSCWAIRYMVVSTGDGQRNILISPRWIKNITRAEDKLYIDFTSEIETAHNSQCFDPSQAVQQFS